MKKTLMTLADISEIKLRYEIPNEHNRCLKVVKNFYKWHEDEEPQVIVLALMHFFDDNGYLKPKGTQAQVEERSQSRML